MIITNTEQKKLNDDFLIAAKGGRASDLIDLVEQGADVNAKSENSFTALHWAVLAPGSATVQALINLNVDVNAKTDEGRTPLHLAATKKNGADAVYIIASARADLDAKNNKGETAIYCAAVSGNREVAKILLASGANPSIRPPAPDLPEPSHSLLNLKNNKISKNCLQL